MAYDFPNSPTVGQIVTGAGSQQWQWDGVKWSALVGTYAGPPPGAIISATPPSFGAGSLWWDTNGAQLYVRYDDGTSVQWVPATSIAQLSNAATQTDVLAAQNNVGRNVIHNPLFNIAQRGVGSFTTTGYTLDRWSFALSLDVASVARTAATDTIRAMIGDEGASLLMSGSVAGNAGAGSYTFVYQPIEDVRRLAGKTVTISFWAGANSGTAKLGVSLTQNFGTGGSPSADVIINGQSVTVSSTFTRYSLTFTIPSIAGMTMGTNGNSYTSLALWFSSGATQNVRAGNIGVQTWNWNLWGVQLEIGSVATPLEKPDPRYDLANCQRMFCICEVVARSYVLAGGSLAATAYYPVTMRAQPTLGTLANSAAGNVTGSPTLFYESANVACIQVTATASGDTYFRSLFTATADL